MAALGPQDWQQISRLYDEASELDGAELEAWLAALAPTDRPLLPRLRQMLAARSEAAAANFLHVLPAAAPAPSAVSPGVRIGPYRLERLLGRGGMAEVWLARRAEDGPQRAVAIKLLHGWRTGTAFAPRFGRERDILAGLSHPRIASLFDAGTSEQGWPYLVLEYVDGEPITEHADRLRLGVRARIELFRQALLAVQHAHAHLVLHRDLKPANILVTADGWVKLLDFGIAKLLAPTDVHTDDTELTREAGRPLTPRYASPEQVQGLPLSTASDVYSLGVVLYELLCGHAPCEPDSTLPGALERAIVETDPRPASQRVDDTAAERRGGDVRSLRRELSAELDALLAKALAKELARRYGSVDLLLADIDRWLNGETVRARAPSAWWRLTKFCRRHRVGVTLGALAVAGMMGMTGVALLQAQRARQEAATALAARGFLLDLFRGADPQSSGGSELSARALLDNGRRQAGALSGQPALQVDLLRGIGQVQLFISDYDNAARAQQDLLRLHRERGDRRGAALAQAELADIALRQGRYEEAARLVAEAAAAAAPDDHELQFRVADVRGWLALIDERFDAAGAQFEQALGHAQAAFGEANVQVVESLRGLSTVRSERGQPDAALALLDRAAAVAQGAAGVTPRDRHGIAFDRVSLLYRIGRYREAGIAAAADAQRCAQELGAADETCAMQLQLQLLSAVNRGDAAALEAPLATLLAVLDRIPAGRRSAEALIVASRSAAAVGRLDAHAQLRARLQRQAEAGPSDALPQTLIDRSNVLLAELAVRERRLDEARDWLQRFKQRPRTEEPVARQRAQAELVEGWIWRAAGDGARAEEALRRARIGHAEAFGAEHPQTLRIDLDLAALIGSRGQRAAALALIDPALTPLRQAWGDDAPAYARALRLQAQLRDVAGGVAVKQSVPEFFN